MLTPAQRIFFDVNGYLLLKSVFTVDECNEFISILDRMRSDTSLRRQDREESTVVWGTAWYDSHMLDTAMSDRFRPIAEDILGGESRLEENQAIISHPGKHSEECLEKDFPRTGWHRGLNPDYAGFDSSGHYHCLIPKLATYLSDNGPNTGTWVVPGSHRMTTPVKEMIKILDRSLVRQVDAEQGDVLLFGETLMHSAPPMDLTSDRYLMIFAYCAHFMKMWSENIDPPEDFGADLTEEQRRFVYGLDRYKFRPA
ncbi:MAG: phytanoyl-CoA dioxygenase family protein [Planctomycetota bacterium]|jgi:ectoine hydroxylase-related dioxygenase (phytanoyl-CoA dioxygenase family)|nr:phytanoyl-CoA dioxygenase family protein [Planctomycetota bacterium]